MKKAFVAVIVLLVIIVALMSQGGEKPVASKEAVKKPPLPVKVAGVTKGGIASRIAGQGSSRAVRREFLTFRKEGKVIMLGKDSSGNTIKEGSFVKGPADGAKGQLLAKIDTRDLQHELISQQADVAKAEQAVASKRAAVKRAENDLKLAENELKRSEGLRQKEIITESKYEQAKNKLLNAMSTLASSKADLNSALATLEASKSTLEKAKLDHEGASIFAPFDGVVTYLNVSIGDYSGPQSLNTSSEDKMLQTAPVVVIDPVEYEISVEFPSYMMNAIHEGQTAYVTRSGISFPSDADKLPSVDQFPYAVAKVYSVSPAVNPGGRSVMIKLRTVEGAKNLRDGMFVTCRIVYAEKNNALKVPSSAVIYRLGVPYAYVVDKETNKADLRKLTTGLQAFKEVEVIKGLSEGEFVVTDGKNMLVDGKEVEVIGAQKPVMSEAAKGEDVK